jgi:hypothetical protein
MADPPITERHKPHFHRVAPVKEPCRAATTANITISTALNNGDTLDGLTLATGDRVLVKDQSSAAENGIYVVGVTPVRAYDVSTVDPTFGYLVNVLAGTANASTLWRNTNTSAPTIGATSLTFAQISGGGASFATPAIVLGAAVAAGAASTVIRSDSTIAAFDATVPVTQALGDTAATGSAAFAARRDHKHAMPALSVATPIVASGSGATGTAAPSSREDHVHPAGAGSGTLTTVEEVDGSPTDSAVTKLVFPNGTLGITAHVATYTPTGGGGGGLPMGKLPLHSDTQAGSTNTNSLALTLGSTPTNGNLLILVSGRDDNGTISSITQTNVTWTLVAKATAAPMVEVWKGVVSASPGTGITVAYSTTSFSQYVVTEWVGITGTLDTSVVNSGTTALGNRPRTPSILPGQTDALVIGGMTTTSNGTPYNSPGVFGNLRTPDCHAASAAMRMLCVFGFPGQTYAHAIANESNSGTQSGVLVSLT